MRKNKHIIWIVSVVCIAGLLRFYNLSRIPPALNSDEVAIGYNAYSILKTGRDEYGSPFPLLFRSFDDYKMPVDVYMIAGSMWLFGYSDFAVRFPSAFFGTLTVFLTYLFVREFFKENGHEYGLVASFLLAVSPWSVLFSRAGYGSNIAVFFSIAGVYFVLRGFRQSWYLVLSSLSFSLSIWSYHSYRIFIPLMLVGLSVSFQKKLVQKKIPVIVAVALACILLLPIVKRTFSIEGRMRAIGVSAFDNPDILKQSITWIDYDTKTEHGIFTLFHNRRIQYITVFLKGYFSHFDPTFLFLDKAIDKYRAPGVGLMYLFELPFLIIGLYQLIRKWSTGSGVILWWLVIAPVAAAFTLQLPHPGRTQTFLPALQIITAVGIIESVRNRFFRGKIIILAVVVVVSVVYFVHQYFVHLPIDNAEYWYAGRKELFEKLRTYEDSYDRIVVSNQLDFPYIFFLYYRSIDPLTYQKQGGTVSGGFTEEKNKFSTYEFRSIHESFRSATERVLFAGLPNEVFNNDAVVDTIYYPNGSKAIVIFR